MRAMIKEILVYEDHLEIKMYISDPDQDSISYNVPAVKTANIPQKGKHPTENCGVLTAEANGSPERHIWLPALAHGDRLPGDLPATLKTT